VADFVEICNVCARNARIEAAKRIIHSDKVCHSYSDLNFGVTFFWNTVYIVSETRPIILSIGGQHDGHLPFWLPSFVKLIMLLKLVIACFVCCAEIKTIAEQ